MIKKNASILMEGLIVMTAINFIVVIMFSYLKIINTGYVNRIHKERAVLLVIDTFEKLISAKNTAVNKNVSNGWKNFIKDIDEKGVYILDNKQDKSAGYIRGEWRLVRQESEDDGLEQFFVSPYAGYRISVRAELGWIKDDLTGDKIVDSNKIAFIVRVTWSNSKEDIYNRQSIEQSMVLASNRLYESGY